MDDAFGHWFAGFFDGEGSFGIWRQARGHCYVCSARIRLRADDEDILGEIARRTGVGKVRGPYETPYRPQVEWIVDLKRDCSRLADIFDRYPLRAKKARDLAIWADAVREWTQLTPDGSRGGPRRDWSRMAHLHGELRRVRDFA